ncbi:MAG: adenylate kinase [Alphaproteobacteria bacterium]|nr:adenylate kinase [Alphaproteobacteria bacterium]
MNIIFLGAPGSGKGTQASMLSSELNIPTISTGEALRKEVEQKSEIGNLAKSYMDSGKLVPDEVVVGIVKNRVSQIDCANGFILDGFPRSIPQAEALAKLVRIDRVVNFEVSDDVLIKRISGRFSCKACGAVYNRYFHPTTQPGICDKCGGTSFESRADDKEETVAKRLTTYLESTLPLTSFYQKKNLLVAIPSVEGAPLVFSALITALNISSQPN